MLSAEAQGERWSNNICMGVDGRKTAYCWHRWRLPEKAKALSRPRRHIGRNGLPECAVDTTRWTITCQEPCWVLSWMLILPSELCELGVIFLLLGWGIGDQGGWAVGSRRRDKSLLDSNPVPPLFLLTASMKKKTQKGGAKVASSSPFTSARPSVSLLVLSLQDPTRKPLPPGQPTGRTDTQPRRTEASPHTSSIHRITNFAGALKWLWLFRFRNISRPVRVILYLNYLNAIYPLKQFPLHRRSVFFFRELKHDK